MAIDHFSLLRFRSLEPLVLVAASHKDKCSSHVGRPVRTLKGFTVAQYSETGTPCHSDI